MLFAHVGFWVAPLEKIDYILATKELNFLNCKILVFRSFRGLLGIVSKFRF